MFGDFLIESSISPNNIALKGSFTVLHAPKSADQSEIHRSRRKVVAVAVAAAAGVVLASALLRLHACVYLLTPGRVRPRTIHQCDCDCGCGSNQTELREGRRKTPHGIRRSEVEEDISSLGALRGVITLYWIRK